MKFIKLSLIFVLLLILPQVCVNLDFGVGLPAIASSVFGGRSAANEEESVVTSKREKQSASNVHEKRQSSQQKRHSGKGLTSRGSSAQLVQRDQMRVQRETYFRGILAKKREVRWGNEQKRSWRTQIYSNPNALSATDKKRTAAERSILALEDRAADKLPELRALDENDRLEAREERLRAVRELVARVRRQTRSNELDHNTLDEQSSRVASRSSGSSTSRRSTTTSIMHGTMVYEANTNTTATWCRSTCDDEQIMCASFLFIDNDGICVFHHDIE